jgi:DNA-directed RNA polymerase specialized sigma24 family protein
MNDDQPKSITILFQELQDGDAQAAAKLWTRFFERLVDFARGEMQNTNRRVSDEEDIACGVMTALCRRADQGCLPTIENRDDLWHLLLSWTRHDIIDHVRKHQRLKRGGGKVRGDSILAGGPNDWGQILGTAPAPDLIAEMEEQYQELLEKLPDKVLRSIAVDKMNGFTHQQLARKLAVSTRTVERKLDLIRRHWRAP